MTPRWLIDRISPWKRLAIEAPAVDVMQNIVAAKNRVIAELKANADSASVELPAADVYWAIFIKPTLDPSLGGTDAWIAAGQLGVIESPELRQRLQVSATNLTTR